jgi:hypothetical protein
VDAVFAQRSLLERRKWRLAERAPLEPAFGIAQEFKLQSMVGSKPPPRT